MIVDQDRLGTIARRNIDQHKAVFLRAGVQRLTCARGLGRARGQGSAVVWTDTRYASRRLCLDSDCCDGGAASQQSFSSMFCMSCLSRACLGKSSCVVRFPYRAMRTQKEEAIMAACCFLQMQPLCPATGATGRSKHLLPHPESSDQNQCTRLVQTGPRCSL